MKAPSLHSSLGWLNTDRPLDFDGELRGQVVLIDFWTYCCINCIHILPDLKCLERKYADQPVAFIGVHSAKFTNEADRQTIRAAILRYEIRHPVIIDEGMRIWREYGARSWPTVIIVGPDGHIVGAAAGEGNREALDRSIAQTLEIGRSRGRLAPGPLSLRLEQNVPAVSGLAFPGKIFADPELGRLFVADSNHNRIIAATLPDEAGCCEVVQIIGGGEIGADDGPAETATFDHPQGLVTGQGKLYVADTENHLIRAVDLSTWTVATVAGTGRMTNDRAGGGMGRMQGLNSPWDLTREGSTLYVAMAGTHQIWRIDLPVGFARAMAGTGRENLVDGLTEQAALAQPSGICMHRGRIYFADSEVSAIRGIDLADEKVFTVIGEGLFAFGDVDGAYPTARLQHPLGISSDGVTLLIADTYNHKIKRVDPEGRSVMTLYGDGTPGGQDGAGRPRFFEPGGLCAVGHDLYVADTNNHRVVHIDTRTGAWRELIFEGLSRSDRAGVAFAASADDAEAVIMVEEQVLAADVTAVGLTLDVTLPEGAHLNTEAPWSIRVRAGGRTLLQKTGKEAAWPLRAEALLVQPSGGDRPETLFVEAAFAYCIDGDRGICAPVGLRWQVPLRYREGGADCVHLVGTVMGC